MENKFTNKQQLKNSTETVSDNVSNKSDENTLKGHIFEDVEEILSSQRNVLTYYETTNLKYSKYVAKYYNFIDKNMENINKPVSFELDLDIKKSDHYYYDINFMLCKEKLKFFGYYKRKVNVSLLIDLIKDTNNCAIYPNLKEEISMEDMIKKETVEKLLKSNKIIYTEDYGMKFYFRLESKDLKLDEIYVDCFINGYLKYYENENNDIKIEINTLKFKSLIHRFIRDLTI